MFYISPLNKLFTGLLIMVYLYLVNYVCIISNDSYRCLHLHLQVVSSKIIKAVCASCAAMHIRMRLATNKPIRNVVEYKQQRRWPVDFGTCTIYYQLNTLYDGYLY